jgi:phosphohistidine phosphatase SixA
MRIGPFIAIAAATVFTLAAPVVLPQPLSPESGASPAREPPPAELIAELRRGNYILYFRHASTDRTESDARMKGFDDCANQRNLTDKGRHDAQLIGGAIRTLSIPIGKVLASPYCRTVETAQLAFARVEKMNEARYGNAAKESAERATDLRKLLAIRPEAGVNTVIVGHGSPIQAVSGLMLGEGDIAVIRPLDNRFEVYARIRVQDWATLTK